MGAIGEFQSNFWAFGTYYQFPEELLDPCDLSKSSKGIFGPKAPSGRMGLFILKTSIKTEVKIQFTDYEFFSRFIFNILKIINLIKTKRLYIKITLDLECEYIYLFVVFVFPTCVSGKTFFISQCYCRLIFNIFEI